jgi:flagellar biosynthesis protein FlhG
MADQADKLRSLRLVTGGVSADGKIPPSQRGRRAGSAFEARGPIPARPRVRSIALTSGKGGVGKTSIATNLAIAFAREGHRVLLVDGDLSLANVDLLLGVVPQKNLGDVIFGRASIEQVVLKTVDGVLLLPSASGVEELADLDDFRRERLLRELARLEASVELILLDTGSGIGRQTIHFARAADEVVVVTTPEPTAFSDAYATLKVLSQGRLHGRPGIVVNMAATPEEGRETERRIRLVAERFLQLRPEYLGHIALDPSVGRAVRQQQPLLKAFPRSPAAAGIEALAARLLADPPWPEPGEVDPEGFFLKVANFDG